MIELLIIILIFAAADYTAKMRKVVLNQIKNNHKK